MRSSRSASGEECLARLARGHVDLVLLDIWLPKMDGLETLERMRQQGHFPDGGDDFRPRQYRNRGARHQARAPSISSKSRCPSKKPLAR